jgi:site-specific recombinase XerD
MREFRRGWKYSPLSAAKRLEYLRAFFRLCVDAGWLERNPAAALKPSKVPHRPTLPFTEAEVDRLLVAARTLVDFGQYGPRIEPMILLLRYSGLRIQNAACLERRRLDGEATNSSERRGTGGCVRPPSVRRKLQAFRRSAFVVLATCKNLNRPRLGIRARSVE